MSRQSIDAIIAFIKHRKKPERSPWDWTLIEEVLSDMNVLPGLDLKDTGDVAVGGLETGAEMSRRRQHHGGLEQMKTTVDVINEAISDGGTVHITYKDFKGNVTERDVSPLEWESPVQFRAWCHLRQAERHFRVDRIQACRVGARHRTGAAAAQTGSSSRSRRSTENSVAQSGYQVAKVKARKRKTRKRRRRGGRPFTKVVNADQWSRLLSYYKDCLIRENQQQYVIDNSRSQRFFFNAKREVIHDFLEGRVTLEFDTTSGGASSGIASFVEQDRERRAQQLCLGYPVFILDARRLAPLVFAPVTTKEADDKLELRAEDAQPSYAVFDALGLSQEELATVLDDCTGLDPEEDEPDVARWEQSLKDRLSQILNRPLVEGDASSYPKPMTLCMRACLFWANPSIFTRSLIRELRQLAVEDRWSSVPTALRWLLTSVPDHTYQDPPALEQDRRIFVTEVNDEQRRTLTALEGEDFVVVTGPPGTGKSQTVLNIVAQAVLRGQSVLFASRNNQAVDVVMGRLAYELEFRGAVRTGEKSHRRAAAREMQATLDYISTAGAAGSVGSLRKTYSRLTDKARQAESTLHRVRELRALLRSQRQERDSLAELLPQTVANLADAHAPEYDPQEIDHLREVLSRLLTTGFEARDAAEEIESEVWEVIEGDGPQSSLLQSLHRFQDQWGAFGGGFLRRVSFDTLESAEDYIETWLTLLEAFEAQDRIERRRELMRKWQSSSLKRPDDFSPQLRHEIMALAAELETQTLSSLLDDAKNLSKRARDLVDGRQPLLEKILTLVGLQHPVLDAADRLVTLQESVSLDSTLPPELTEDVRRLAAACDATAARVSATLYQSGLDDARELLESARQTFGDAVSRLPEPLQRDVTKVQVPDRETDLLRRAFETLLSRIRDLMKCRERLAARVNSKLNANEDALRMLSAFRESPAGDDNLLWGLRIPVSLRVIVSHLAKWEHLLSLWEIDAKSAHLQEQLDELPTGQQAVEAVRNLKQEQFHAAAKLVKACWLEWVRGTSTEVLQEARRYASAVEQLAQGYDPESYAYLKSSQEDNFRSALRVFPVWATTNLSAKSNLPLEAELFDIVVVDEASQCDIPSALPLLYRGKQIVVIGDPNQLRHIATLYEDSDLDSAAAFNVSPDTFLYNRKSLFDLANASVGTRPGTIMLKEHYRSHPSIVEFSNAEFYDGQLVVQTDLKRQGVPHAFLKNGCGVFWVDVSGEAHRPSGGSAFNPAELRALRQLLPGLVERLTQYGERRYPFSVGAVTPFREQSNRIRGLLRQLFGEDNKVSAGTAHTFQGDERDIIILSPVLGPGLPQGTLRWLNDTRNLLNVALTRPRLQLIVLGNWSYCRDLPSSSVYRRLADHLQDRRVTSYEHLPIFGGEPLRIAGTMIDGTDSEAARVTLRRYLTESCYQFVWWLDRYFYDHVLDLFWSVFQQPDAGIQEVRLLTSKEQLEPAESRGIQFHPDRIKAIHGELQRRGIRFEVRVLPKNELPHDRYLYSRDQSINMPPFGGAYGDHKHVSEYTRSSTGPEFFEQYWDRAAELWPQRTPR